MFVRHGGQEKHIADVVDSREDGTLKRWKEAMRNCRKGDKVLLPYRPEGENTVEYVEVEYRRG